MILGPFGMLGNDSWLGRNASDAGNWLGNQATGLFRGQQAGPSFSDQVAAFRAAKVAQEMTGASVKSQMKFNRENDPFLPIVSGFALGMTAPIGSIKFKRFSGVGDDEYGALAKQVVDAVITKVGRGFTRDRAGMMNALADALKTRGHNVVRDSAATGSEYLSLPEAGLKIRFADHSRYAPSGSNWRGHSAGAWDFNLGSRPSMESDIYSILRSLEDK